MTFSLDSRLRVPDTVVFRELDGEAVVLNLESGIYFGLDAVGTRMWRLVEAHQVLEPVSAALAAEYDAPADRLEADLLRFVGDLHAKGLLTLA